MNFKITLDRVDYDSARDKWFRLLYLAPKQTGEEKIRTENQIAELAHKIFMMKYFYSLREEKERMLNNEV